MEGRENAYVAGGEASGARLHRRRSSWASREWSAAPRLSKEWEAATALHDATKTVRDAPARRHGMPPLPIAPSALAALEAARRPWLDLVVAELAVEPELLVAANVCLVPRAAWWALFEGRPRVQRLRRALQCAAAAIARTCRTLSRYADNQNVW